MALKYLLLGMIEVMPRSGYDLHKAFAHVISQIWSAEQRQVYHALHHLHEVGWVRVETVEQEGVPDKKIYFITEAGRGALLEWIQTPLPPQPYRLDWLGQLFYGHLVEPKAILPILEEQRRHSAEILRDLPRHIADLKAVLQQRPELTPLITMRLVTVHYGMMRHRHHYWWTEHIIRLLQDYQDYQVLDTRLMSQLLAEMDDPAMPFAAMDAPNALPAPLTPPQDDEKGG